MCRLMQGLFLGVLLLTPQIGAAGDPTRPPGLRVNPPAAGAVAKAPRLTSIVISPTHRHAVIDGNFVRVGDRVGTARVVDIELQGVHLQGSGDAFTLRLTKHRVKREPETGDE